MSVDLDATWAKMKEIAAASSRPLGQCQGLMQDIVKGLGGTATGYASARTAHQAGVLETSTPPADEIAFVYYAYPDYDHVDIEYRGERIANSSHVTTKLNRNGSTGIVKPGGYPSSMKRLGWSRTNGKNVLPLIQKPDPIPAPIPAPGQRQVRSDIEANVRSGTSTSANFAGKPLAKNQIVTPLGYLHGGTATAHGVTTDLWLKLAEKQYAWAGGFTDTSTTDLADLTPAPPASTTDQLPDTPATTGDEPADTPADSGPDQLPEPADPVPEEDTPMAETPTVTVPVKPVLDEEALAQLRKAIANPDTSGIGSIVTQVGAQLTFGRRTKKAVLWLILTLAVLILAWGAWYIGTKTDAPAYYGGVVAVALVVLGAFAPIALRKSTSVKKPKAPKA